MAGGLLPAVPIHLDGLTRGITEAYEDMLPLLPEALQNRSKVSKQRPFLTGTVNLVKDRREREGILASERPAVVIASSGMLHAGASPQYAPGVAAARRERAVRGGLPGRREPGPHGCSSCSRAVR